jgi:DNA adenine methylase
MCSYLGGKKRIAKELHAVMLEAERLLVGKRLPYLEPFCGMCSVGVKFDDGRPRTLSDMNGDVVAMWKALMNGWKPQNLNITKEYFDELKYMKSSLPERGFYGTCCSYGGVFMASFYRNNGGGEEATAWNKIQEMIPRLNNVKFYHCEYDQYEPTGMIIYCDPPYNCTKTTVKYNKTVFDSTKFWELIRQWSKNNLVFISEEIAPQDFKCIWSKKSYRTMTQSTRSERLFIHKSYLE